MCAVCNNTHFNCPACSPKVEYQTCPECNGIGKMYFDENGDDVTEEQYIFCPETYHLIVCPMCEGEGELITN